MELSHNWRGLQRLFYPRAREAKPDSGRRAVAPIYLITQRGVVIAAFAAGEDLSDWFGATSDEITRHFQHRDCIAFERDQLDTWLQGASTQPHFIEQMKALRQSALEVSPSRRIRQDLGDLFSREHFLLQAVRGWWNRVLPGEFGLFLRLKGHTDAQGTVPGEDFLLIFRNGTLLSFLEPDLASMGTERVEQPEEVVKYLSEKYLVPVQGVVAPLQDWERWHRSEDPWREVARGLVAKTVSLVPSRGSLSSLLLTKAYLGI
jgi:hypothetical protein